MRPGLVPGASSSAISWVLVCVFTLFHALREGRKPTRGVALRPAGCARLCGCASLAQRRARFTRSSIMLKLNVIYAALVLRALCKESALFGKATCEKVAFNTTQVFPETVVFQ